MARAFRRDSMECFRLGLRRRRGAACLRAGAALFVGMFVCGASRAEDLDLTQQILLLSTLRGSTLQKELQKTAATGYQILFASNVGSGSSAGEGVPQAFTEHNQLILEKVGGSGSTDYVFFKSRGETLASSIPALENDMNEAAAKGYRFHPRTFLGLMEKRDSAESSATPKYRLVQGSSKHLQEEMCKASSDGFRFVDLIGSTVVMEKPSSGNSAPAACPYLVIGARTEHTLRKEINEGAEKGFSIVSASCPGEIVILMEKGPAEATAREYLILDSMRTGKLERDIAEAAGRGFRAIPRAFFSYSVTNVALMEKSAGSSGSYEYKILDAQKASSLQKKMTEAAPQGYRPVAMNSSRVLLLEKTR